MREENSLANLSPEPELLQGEKVLTSFEAGLWDIGLFGFIMRQKERLIVTSYRVFRLSKNFLGSDLVALDLRSVESIRVGSWLKLWRFFLGVALIVGIFASAIFAASPYDYSDYGGYGSSSRSSSGFHFDIVKLAVAAVGFILLVTAREKGLLVATGNDKFGTILMVLKGLKKEDSKRFIDTISKAKQELAGR